MPREKSTPVRRSGHKFEAVIDNSDKALFQQSATQENGIIYEDENNEQIEDEYEEEEEEEANLVSSKKLNGNSFTKDMLLSKKAEYTSSSSSSAAVDDRNNFLLISSHKYSTLNQTYTNSADVEVHAIYNCLMFRHVEASSFADICSVSCPGNVLRSLKSFIASGLLRLCAKIINNQIALHIHMSIMKIQIYPSIPSFLVRWIWATDESSNTPEWVEIRPTPFRVHRFLAKASQCANNKMLAFSTIDQGLLERTLQDRGLLTTMRRYQLQGVMWMLQRLGYSFPSNETKAVISRDGSEDGNLCGWIPLISSNVSTSMVSSGSSSSAAVGDCGIWYNLITEELKIGRPRDDITQHPSPRSLLLSDVMGMGKTLQIISLVLAIKLSHRHETSIPLCKPSLVHSSENNQLNEDDIADEYDEAGACLCERPTLISTDVDWVQCPTCRGWSHAACYGFNSSEAAESAQAFICLACECRAASRPGCKLQSHATVVLMPNPLLAQWVSEIRKHISSQRLVVEYEFAESTQTKEPSTSSTVDNAESDLSSSDSKSKHSIETNSPFRVFVYESSAVNDLKRRGLTFANIRPSALASYDLILLDLRTLQRDFHLVKATSGYEGGARTSSRPRNAHENKRTKSAYFPPPFMCIQFELVVVDETQKLESEGENQALYLARSLDARCQVSVSGTPLGTERASDLRPLCQFLRLVPFDTDDRSSSLMWNRIFGERSICVNESIRMKWLESLFSGVILRRTKEMVREQLELKDQLEITKPLLFSEFEVC